MNSNVRDVSLVTLTAFTELGKLHSVKYLHLSFTISANLTQSDILPAAWELSGWARSPVTQLTYLCSEERKNLSGKVILYRKTKPTGPRAITSTANLQNTDICKCAHIPLGFAGLYPACYSCCNLWQFMEDESVACLINCPHPCSYSFTAETSLNQISPPSSSWNFSLDETLQIILEGTYRHDNEGLSEHRASVMYSLRFIINICKQTWGFADTCWPVVVLRFAHSPEAEPIKSFIFTVNMIKYEDLKEF